MTKKARLALCVALLIPLVFFSVTIYKKDGAVVMPRRFHPDSVISVIKDGKQIIDTAWHKNANIKLVNQLGDTVSLYDIKGKAIIMDFFFTSCASICPTLTKNMAMLQRGFLKGGDPMQPLDSSVVHFISFSIDPERDSVERLKAYADRFGAKHDSWWFLTGSKDSIYNFAFQELQVDKSTTEPIDPNFVHTSRFVLLDQDYVIRGYYDGLDSGSLNQLAHDVGLLMMENDPYHPAPLPFDPKSMGLFFLATFIIVIIGIFFIFKKKS